MSSRRSRKRSRTASGAAPAPAPPAPAPARPPVRQPGRRARLEDAPPAPWSPFPLVELTILAGIVLTVLGAFNLAGERLTFVVCGIALIYIATLELSIREHFAGYRSHSTLLGAVAAILVAVPLGRYTSIPFEVIGAISLLVFGAAFAALRAAFRRRTGGIGFRA
ncbi:MAG TPA: hypothetical protein VIL49_16525 [Capillimicrobium sp.]|jgi:hypothetical protein